MKKILLFFTAIGFAIGMTACQETEPVVEDSAVQTLQEAYDSLNALITDPSNITGGFSVPTALKGGEVTAEWSSTNPGVLTVGEESEGLATVTVNRPAFGDPDAEVTLKAMLSIPSALDTEQMLQLEWMIELTIKANTVEEVSIESIADVLAVTEVEYDGTYQVTLSGLTIVAKGNQSAFAYDGTGMIMIYGGDMALLEVGKVYTISATIEWYYGIWELTDWTATEEAGSAPMTSEPEVVTDLEGYIDAMIASGENSYGDGNAASGSFEARHLKVTGKVFVIPEDTSDYNTYLMPSDYDTTQAWVGGTDENPVKGLMLYRDTMDMASIRSYDGLVVTIEVIVYTYRTDRDTFAIYYIGGPNGIEATLTDGEKLTIDANALQLPSEVIEPSTLSLPSSGENGTTITWTSSDETIINSSTGEVTMPANGQAIVTLTATLELGTETPVTKEFIIKVGVPQLMTIEEALGVAHGEMVTVQGYVTTNIDGRNFLIQDGHHALDIYTNDDAVKTTLLSALADGLVVELRAKRGAYGGLEQLSDVEYMVVVDETEISRPVAYNLQSTSELESLKARMVLLESVEVQSTSTDSYGNLDIVVLMGTSELTVRWDSRTTDPAGLPTELVAGDVVSIMTGLSWGSSGARLRIDSANDVSRTMTIAAALSEASDTEVTVVGYVTMNVDGSNFFIEDSTGAIDIYAGGSTPAAVKELLAFAWANRLAVIIRGERGAYGGLEQLSSVSRIFVLDKLTGSYPVPTTLTETTFSEVENYKAKIIRLEGLVVVSTSTDSYGNLDIIVKLGETELTIRWDSRTGDPAGFALTLLADDVIDAEVGVSWGNSGVRLRIDEEGDVTRPLLTIAEALALTDNFVTVRGYVTANIDGSNYFIQDSTGAIDVYAGGSTSDEIKEAMHFAWMHGLVIEIQAQRGAYGGLEQLSNIELVDFVAYPTFALPDPTEVTSSAELSNHVAEIVILKNLEVVSLSYDNYGNLDITFLMGNEELEVRWDSRTGDPVGLPTELVAGDTFNLTAAVYFRNSAPALRIDSAADVELIASEPEPVSPDVFISEYIEGSSNNKALELYNPTSEAIDLTGYMINYYNNGATDSSGNKKSYDLSGIVLPAGGTYTIVTDSFAGTGTYDEVQAYADSDSVVFFNGDDTITLTKNGEIIDIIGVLGEDPWTLDGAEVAWAEHTYVRKSGTTSGSTVWDPTEWDEYEQNDFSHLGTHTA